ncbi:hypothetical protein JOB18_006013 [Solea senegalensis]|uniref:Uncharacterized protein n=1 Tax=Solea senegalensis TaxID=28829 RepID=A0AAV6R3Q2_SOLSE|nr:hypothetical protein JOB18_006013 [Solea senegalensis]
MGPHWPCQRRLLSSPSYTEVSSPPPDDKMSCSVGAAESRGCSAGYSDSVTGEKEMRMQHSDL